MSTFTKPKPAADLLAAGIMLGAVALALFVIGIAVVEPVSSYSSDPGPTVWLVFGGLAAAGAAVCSAVGVHRLVTHADRAALLAHERGEQRRAGHDDGGHAGPRDAARGEVGA